jgi:uncharacterized integral membrane protein
VRREDDPNDAVPEGKGVGEYRRESGPSGTTITLLVVGVLLAVFVAQNMDAANVDFLFWDTDVSLGLTLLIAAALGFVLGWGFAWMRRRARRLARRDDRRD